MLPSLKFVQGSVAKKGLVAALTHFSIDNGLVRGFNGTLALCSPIPFNISCKPKADLLIKAIANCEDTVQLTLSKSGRLQIKSGVFKVSVLCVEGETPHVEPEGTIFQFDGSALLKALKAVSPFIGDDASRPWANGVLIKDGSLFATNNVMLVQYWIGALLPFPINLPRSAVKEMLRIGEAPTFAQVDKDNSITFHYEGDRWLRTQLYVTEWPDLSKILDQESTQTPIDDRLFKGLEIIKPFLDTAGSVYIADGQIYTHLSEEDGAAYDIPDMQYEGLFNHSMLSLLEGAAKTIDWSTYPKACLFQGGMLRGAIIGMRK